MDDHGAYVELSPVDDWYYAKCSTCDWSRGHYEADWEAGIAAAVHVQFPEVASRS